MDRYVIRVIDESGHIRFLGHDKSRVITYENPFMFPILFKSEEEAIKSSGFYLKHLDFKPAKVDIMKITMVQAGTVDI